MDFLNESTTALVASYASRVIGVLVLFAVAWILAGFVQRWMVKGFDRAKFDATLGKFFAKMARWAILIVAVIAGLGIFGVQTTSFAAVLAAAGFAIGLAFQGSLANFSAGVMLLIFRPFKLGDFIKVAGESGTVFEIDLFTTSLDTPDNRRLILPNRSVFGTTIENISHHPTRRVDVDVGVSYDANLDQTRSVLEKAVSTVEGQLADKAAQVVLKDLGASSVDWQVRLWTNAGDYWPLREKTVRAVKLALDDAKMGIPYPQLDVHVNGGALDALEMGARRSTDTQPQSPLQQ